jgi:predicted amino acid-binding ACT domain protein
MFVIIITAIDDDNVTIAAAVFSVFILCLKNIFDINVRCVFNALLCFEVIIQQQRL